jgi:tRNA pseudouridine55 synthase
MSEAQASGLIVVDKPSGWTSHQVVGRIRRLQGTRKVGHAGTLDPMATGVLLVGVNRATRLLGYLAGHDKAYEATIRLGQSTTTDDAEGEIVTETPVTVLDPARLGEEVSRLTGPILQRPSSVSAIKVDGQRAYARVRKGEQVELAERPVTVTAFLVGEIRPGDGWVDVDVAVECSSGTYIRALARDLGAALGVGGHLTYLRRTRIGGFGLDEALPQSVLAPITDRPGGADGAGVPLPVIPLATVVRRCFTCVQVTDDRARDVRHGRPLPMVVDGLTALLHDDRFLALYEPGRDGRARAVAVFDPS